MIVIENISKSFGALKALQNLSFNAENGFITGLLGPNGAGKSTAMRLISGTLKPESGRILVDSVDMQQDPLRARELLGILGDAKGLYGRMTAKENIEYYGHLRGMSRQQINSSLEELVTMLQMSDLLDQRTAGMSTGQKVKVALARALIHDPPNILLDEPTSGLDVMATKAMRNFIRALQVKGRSIIFTSHIIQEVAEVCDYIHLVQHGRLIASGTKEELMLSAERNNLEDAILSHLGG